MAARIVDYFKNGSTSTSVNFPNIQPSGTRYLHRFAHIHRNIPGQNPQTRGSIGYAVIDINSDVVPEIIEALGKIPHTIRSRVVF